MTFPWDFHTLQFIVLFHHVCYRSLCYNFTEVEMAEEKERLESDKVRIPKITFSLK